MDKVTKFYELVMGGGSHRNDALYNLKKLLREYKIDEDKRDESFEIIGVENDGKMMPISLYEARPKTFRPPVYNETIDFSDVKRISEITSENDTVLKRHSWAAKQNFRRVVTSLDSSFLDMDSPQTYGDLLKSADQFFRLQLLQQSMAIRPDYEGIALAGYYLTQHDVLIIREGEKFSKKINALISFPDAVAGVWTMMKGDLLLFPSPPGSEDYFHLRKTLRDIIVAMKHLQFVRSDNNYRVEKFATSFLLANYDQESGVFMDRRSMFARSVKPIFSDVNYVLDAKEHEIPKLVLMFELIQKAVLIYIKFAEQAIHSKRLGAALALCRLQLYCCGHLSLIVNSSDLDTTAYTHIMTNWMLGNVNFLLYEKLVTSFSIYDEDDEHFETKEEIYPMFDCISDRREDFRNLRHRDVLYLQDFHFPQKDLLRNAYDHFSKVSVPPHWRRTTFRKLLVQCKVLFDGLKKIMETVAYAAKDAHSQNRRNYSDGYYSYHSTSIIPESRARAAELLDNYFEKIDTAFARASKDLADDNTFSDYREFLALLLGKTWKLSAVAEASNYLLFNRQQSLEDDVPISRLEANSYKEMKKHFLHAIPILDNEISMDAYCKVLAFRVRVIMEVVKEEVMLQIEKELRDENYEHGLLGLVETLAIMNSILVGMERHDGLRKDCVRAFRTMAALFLSGLATIYGIRYQRELKRSSTEEELGSNQSSINRDNARYYLRALAVYMKNYPYVTKEVLSTYGAQVNILADFYCGSLMNSNTALGNGGDPLSALAVDLLVLRRLMPALPILWELCLARRSTYMLVGYDEVEITTIGVPFEKSFIDNSFGPHSQAIHSSISLLQELEESDTLDGDCLFGSSGNMRSYGKRIFHALSDKIKIINPARINFEDLSGSLATTAGDIALLICEARSESYLEDASRTVRLTQTFSTTLATELLDILSECYLIDTAINPSKKTLGYFSIQWKYLAFASSLVVLSAMLGIHAMDRNELYFESDGNKSLARAFLNCIFASIVSFLSSTIFTGRHDERLRHHNKMWVFMEACRKHLSVRTVAECRIEIQSNVFLTPILMLSNDLKRSTSTNELFKSPIALMLKETSELFAYTEGHSEEGWHFHSDALAKSLSLSLLRTELKTQGSDGRPYEALSLTYERDQVAEGEVVLEYETPQQDPPVEANVGKLPTNIEQFHVDEETNFRRQGIMYKDHIFEDIFSLYTSYPDDHDSINLIGSTLRRLLKYLRVDLENFLKITNNQYPALKLYGADLNQKLLRDLKELSELIACLSSDHNYLPVHVVRALHVLDRRFYGSATTSLLRGSLLNKPGDPV